MPAFSAACEYAVKSTYAWARLRRICGGTGWPLELRASISLSNCSLVTTAVQSGPLACGLLQAPCSVSTGVLGATEAAESGFCVRSVSVGNVCGPELLCDGGGGAALCVCARAAVAAIAKVSKIRIILGTPFLIL